MLLQSSGTASTNTLDAVHSLWLLAFCATVVVLGSSVAVRLLMTSLLDVIVAVDVAPCCCGVQLSVRSMLWPAKARKAAPQTRSYIRQHWAEELDAFSRVPPSYRKFASKSSNNSSSSLRETVDVPPGVPGGSGEQPQHWHSQDATLRAPMMNRKVRVNSITTGSTPSPSPTPAVDTVSME